MIILYFFSLTSPLDAMRALITSKAAFAASALISSCGKKAFLFSKSAPIMLSEGIIHSFTIASGSLSESFSVKRAASSLSPLRIALRSASSGANSVLSVVFVLFASVSAEAYAMYSPH